MSVLDSYIGAKMTAMRRAAGITLISSGAIALAIYGMVMLRLPIPLYLPSRLGIVGIHVDRVRTPVSAVVSLAAGMLLLLRRSKPPAKILPPQ